jgi:hypothetical protein
MSKPQALPTRLRPHTPTHRRQSRCVRRWEVGAVRQVSGVRCTCLVRHGDYLKTCFDLLGRRVRVSDRVVEVTLTDRVCVCVKEISRHTEPHPSGVGSRHCPSGVRCETHLPRPPRRLSCLKTRFDMLDRRVGVSGRVVEVALTDRVCGRAEEISRHSEPHLLGACLLGGGSLQARLRPHPHTHRLQLSDVSQLGEDTRCSPRMPRL